jgi:hypothetical protein
MVWKDVNISFYYYIYILALHFRSRVIIRGIRLAMWRTMRSTVQAPVESQWLVLQNYEGGKMSCFLNTACDIQY